MKFSAEWNNKKYGSNHKSTDVSRGGGATLLAGTSTATLTAVWELTLK